MNRQEIGQYLMVDPEICHGQMTFKGTRVPVDTVLALLAKGYLIEQLLQSWPELSKAAIEEAVHFAWIAPPSIPSARVPYQGGAHGEGRQHRANPY